MWNEEELICKPLDTYEEVFLFLENPPSWRTLCKELMPHSKFKIRNYDLNNHFDTTFLETPETFCHVRPDMEDVIRHEEKTLPKTLVCHDMANGYHDDSYIDGTANNEAYTFYNWAGIDIFCYFSHHLITIPPLSWINVGHAHGVKVIGTVISEWAEGIVFWDKVLESEQKYQNFASALVAITKSLKFDGWLLNVENKISKPDVLLSFVKYFHRILHREIPHAELIWYDGVTILGTLNWQNGLNEKNRAFFEACDGIFTNYSWSEADIEDSSLAAGDRITDLYIGIDVWGRNFYGGGQFNTQEAVKVAHCYGCSLAIFAPAWTHEALSSDQCDVNAVAMAEGMDKFHKFLLRDRALWGSLWPFLNTRLPSELPFSTSFCRGLGKKRRMYGEVLSNTPWYNLRHQQYQLNSAHGPHGYLLSTFDTILQHYRRNIYKDMKGILRYRNSFKLSRLELHSKHTNLGGADRVDADEDADEDNEEDAVEHVVEDVVEDVVEHVVENAVEHVVEDAVEHVVEDAVEDADEDKNDVEGQIEQKKSNEHVQDEQKTVKRKMRNVLKSLLQFKTPKWESSVDGSEPSSSKIHEDDDDSTKFYGSGKSMMRVSINLKLGQKGSSQKYGLACVPEESECFEFYQDDCFNGGSCLRINPNDYLSPEHRLSRLFHCDFVCENTLIVCVVTKHLSGFLDQCLNMKFFMKNANDEDLKVVLVGRPLPQLHQVADNPSGVLYVYPLDTSGPAFKQVQVYLLLNESGFYVPVENSFGWTVRYYELHLPGSRVTSINCRTCRENDAILLGHLGICHKPKDA